MPLGVMYTEKLQALLLPGSSILRVVCTPRQLDTGNVELIRANIYVYSPVIHLYCISVSAIGRCNFSRCSCPPEQLHLSAHLATSLHFLSAMVIIPSSRFRFLVFFFCARGYIEIEKAIEKWYIKKLSIYVRVCIYIFSLVVKISKV